MKEIVLSVVISSLTIIAGYVVIKKTDIDILEYFKAKDSSSKKLTKLKENKNLKISDLKEGNNNKEKLTFKKKKQGKKKIIKSEVKGKIKSFQENEAKRNVASVIPGKKVISKKGKVKKIIKEEIKNKIEENLKIRKSSNEKKARAAKTESSLVSPIALKKSGEQSDQFEEEFESERGSKNALKRKKSNYINLEPILTKVGDLSVNETDLDDILIDINDEKQKKMLIEMERK